MGHLQLRYPISLIATLAFVCGCGQSPSEGEGPAGAAGGPGKDTSKSAAGAVKTAQLPSDACGWIPASDVEQVIGKLEGPPRAERDECIYSLVDKSPTFAKLLEARRHIRRNNRRGVGDHDFHDVIKISVDVSGGDVIRERTTSAMAETFAKELGQSTSLSDKKEAPPAGWDATGAMPYTWMGRAGHVSIAVFSPPEISDEKKMALAARVRDQIPDLPFPTDNPYQVPTSGSDRNPCDLLTRAEVEAVLGKLVIEPYRAIENSPLAYAQGKACAYYTPGHRVFVITPEWSDGASQFKMTQGLAGLIGSNVPLENPAIEGPWDKGLVNGTTGTLLLLKGDRLLEVDYLTSSADRGAALKLAAQAMQRLAS